MIDAAEREKVARELAKWLLVRVSHLGILTLESPQCVAEISERMALCANEALEAQQLSQDEISESFKDYDAGFASREIVRMRLNAILVRQRRALKAEG